MTIANAFAIALVILIIATVALGGWHIYTAAQRKYADLGRFNRYWLFLGIAWAAWVIPMLIF